MTMEGEPHIEQSLISKEETTLSEEYNPDHHEYVQGLEAGVMLLQRKIQTLLETKGHVIVAVAGKTGSGKTTIANTVRSRLMALSGIEATVISTDSFIPKGSHAPDLIRLHAAIDATKYTNDEVTPSAKVVIVEGLQTMSDDTLGQKPDLRTYVAVPAAKRFAARLLRDNTTGFKSIGQSLQILADINPESLKAIQEFERTPPSTDLDIIINNDRNSPGEPQLYVDGTTIVFSSPQGVQTIGVAPDKIPMLKQIGIPIKTYPIGAGSR